MPARCVFVCREPLGTSSAAWIHTRFRQLTENRAAAPAVIGPASTPKPPARESAVAGALLQGLVADARRPTANREDSTLIGATAAHAHPARLADVSPFPSSMVEAARRVAATNSIAFADRADAKPWDAADPYVGRRAGAPLVRRITEIQWPPDRTPTKSDGPQEQTLNARGSPRRARPADRLRHHRDRAVF